MDDTVMVSHCPECGTETDAADFHFMPGDGGLVTTYECRGCGKEKPVDDWLKQAFAVDEFYDEEGKLRVAWNGPYIPLQVDKMKN